MPDKPNSCKQCKFFNGMTFRGEYECDWLYKRYIPLPPYLAISGKHHYSTDDCYPKRFKEDLGKECVVFESTIG